LEKPRYFLQCDVSKLAFKVLVGHFNRYITIMHTQASLNKGLVLQTNACIFKLCNFPSKCRAWNFIGLPANCSSKASATAACSSSAHRHALAYSRLRPMHAYASNITV
jgi:hypothetical protein